MFIEIDYGRILQNISVIKKSLTDGVKFCAVVKADAYGHGMAGVSREIEGEADFFAVARMSEGAALRKAGIKKPVLILNTLLDGELEEAIENGLSVTVDDAGQAGLIADICKASGKTAGLHIKIDTGMNRLGLKSEKEFDLICEKIENSRSLNCEGVYSHLVSTVFKNPALTEKQCGLFKKYADIAVSRFPGALRHLSNTSAALSFPDAHFDMVRIGLGMYGYSDRKDAGLLPAKSVRCRVLETKTAAAGEGVGYDRAYVAENETPVAVLDCGYGDGYYRNFAKNGKVLTESGFRAILGNVCMDLIMVENPGGMLKKGDEVIILGENNKSCLWANDIFENCGTIIYETLCNLKKR